ncbi:MAG: MFS transporter, partial [Pseudomonadota bacterium]
MWTSTAASGFGDRTIMLVAMSLLGGLVVGADATGTNASTQFWFFIPYLLFSLVGGWLADRLPRKWLMLGCDEFRGAVLLVSWWALLGATGSAALDEAYHWRVCVALFLVGAAAATFNPARNAIIPQIVPPHQLQAGNAVILVINVIASMVGMVIIGATLDKEAVESVRLVLLLGAMFFVISGLFFAFLKPVDFHDAGSAGVVATPKPESKTSSLAYVLTHRRVAMLLLIDMLLWSSASMVVSAPFGIGQAFYGVPESELLAYGTRVGATVGAGMLAGGGLIALINTRRESPTVYLLGVAAGGLAVLAFALVPWGPVTYAAAFVVGMAG